MGVAPTAIESASAIYLSSSLLSLKKFVIK